MTMTSCKFLGFRRAVHADGKAHVKLKDCLVDLSFKAALCSASAAGK
jgi:hypothetical protein